jgi:hypothetical protein
MDKVVVLFKEWVVFKQYIPNKHKCFEVKNYKLCDVSGYMYGMDGYSGKDKTSATAVVTAVHATVKQLTKEIEEHGQLLFIA